MYEVSPEIYDNILDEMMSELDERNYSYDESALKSILDTWLERKQPLLELLSKHPNWDAERLMIKFDTDFSRKINTDVTGNFVSWLFGLRETKEVLTKPDEEYGDWFTTYSELGEKYNDVFYNSLVQRSYMTEEDQPYLEILNSISENFRFRVGMKTTKIVRKIFEHHGWTKIMRTETDYSGNTVEYNAFEREYAKFCDALCPIKVTRHTCISLNPLDFLLMSNGNSWHSCHDIGEDGDSGCYSSGVISLMLDNHSFVFYTVDASFDGEDIELEPKLQRQLFAFHDNQLLQSRLYPQANDYGAKEIYTDIRNIVQKIVADCCGKPNLWIKKKVTHNLVHTGNGATCYADWFNFDHPSVSVFKDCADETHEPIVMGAYPICIECGYTHNETENINHCSGGMVCESCGRHISRDDVHWVGDDPYCGDCVTYCERCGNYELNDYATWIESEDRYICEYCRDEYYSRCEHCGDWYHNDDLTYVDSTERYVCEDCLDYTYYQCEDCEEYFPRKDMNEYVNPDTGEVCFYCDECYAEREENEDE